MGITPQNTPYPSDAAIVKLLSLLWVILSLMNLRIFSLLKFLRNALIFVLYEVINV